MNKLESTFFCECGTECIVLERDAEGESITLAMFEFRNAWQTDLRTRLRHIWHIIKTGYPYADDLIMDTDTAKALGYKLIEWTTPSPTNEVRMPVEE